MDPLATDLVLLHPPSVYDSRSDGAIFGPISNVIASTPVFEMYPVGLTTIADHLGQAGFNVETVNVAYRMLADRHYDAEAEIAALHPLAFGIDLHWLPHAHGALELAQLIKARHPDTPVIMSGLSASYYHRELIDYPWVDYVVRGDSTEAPMLQLLRALRSGDVAIDTIPNLTWTHPRHGVVVNPLRHVPDDIDEIAAPDYVRATRSGFNCGRLANVMPDVDGPSEPITALLTARGCTQNCVTCGGSRSAYRAVCNRKRPAFRSPEALVGDIRRIGESGNAPILLVHDVRQGGPEYTQRFLDLLQQETIENELIFELFSPADDEYLGRLAAATSRYSLEMALDSQDERLRRLNGKFACSNQKVEATIDAALRNGVSRIDIFFTVGLPQQTYSQALGAVDYCRHLLERAGGDRRLRFFSTPTAPFLDPGSRAFTAPKTFGYTLHHQTLEEHRQALTAPSWKYLLNYETESMDRDDIVDATYETALRLARLKRDHGYMDAGTCTEISARIAASRLAVAEVDRALQLPEGGERDARLEALHTRFADLSAHGPGAERELLWPTRRRFARLRRFLRHALQLVRSQVQRLGRRILRLAGRPQGGEAA